MKLAEQIKNKSFSRFQLIYGEERYMVKYYKNALMSHLSTPGDEMNCTCFQGKSVNPSEVADVAQILPFMAEQRLIVIQDSGFFQSANDMVDFLEEFPESTYLVFVEEKVDKRNKLYKFVQKNGCVTECKYQNMQELCGWVAGYLGKCEKRITKSVAEYLIGRVGNNMDSLTNEMDKLIGYVGEKNQIDMEDIDEICDGVTEGKIFEMLDAVSSKNKELAMKLYADLLANREPAPIILSMFRRHINILLLIHEGQQKGMRSADLAAYASVPGFTVNKYIKQVGSFKYSQMKRMLENVAQAEEDYKTGKMGDQISLDLFLVQALTN